ncbi:type II toxin-antitoxin system VapC family toxin [Mesorhizobium sp. 1B3]|uniref:type II toxin-antitoxin system VapC family toxin n=1 Tax=Mesorhizobium sp. 1B3 TaxID=3243599 RepID=UPI003D9824FC
MIVLDTHALIWWVSGETSKLSKKAHQSIDDELRAGQIIVSSISAWEVAMLVARDRLALSVDVHQWLAMVGEIDRVSFKPVDNTIAARSCTLPGEFHKDPADRMIVATARELAAPVVSADAKIIAYPHVVTIW